MNYYTSTISVTLAEKLKEKGMPVEIVDDSVEEWPNCKECHCETQYGEVFDWLISEKNTHIRIVPFDCSKKGATSWDWSWYIDQLGEPCIETDYYWHTWHEAANIAIEKALTLI